MDLANRSAAELRSIAAQATQLAADLEATQPSVALAIAAGVCDASYQTVRFGLVLSYRGEAVITMADGSRWRAVGHGPSGTPAFVSREGYVEFVPLDAGVPESRVRAAAEELSRRGA